MMPKMDKLPRVPDAHGDIVDEKMFSDLYTRTSWVDANVALDQIEKPKHLVKQIHEMLGNAPDVSIDCSGLKATNRLALLTTKSGGCVVCGPPKVKTPLISRLTREIDIHGVFCNDYPAALALVFSGSINAKKSITHHLDITETKEAFDTARYNRH